MRLSLFKLIILQIFLTTAFVAHALDKESFKDARNIVSRRSRRRYIDGAKCDRKCTGENKSCFFRFEVETYFTMSKACYKCPEVMSDCFRPQCVTGGGIGKVVILANRQLPGPSIVVCQGDEVMVYVDNKIDDGQATSIHWHGQHLIEDQYMDGVPWVTQCPVHSGNGFTYEYYANDAGTYFWHSHIRVQRGEGLFGPLIVRQCDKHNVHRSLYDEDLTDHVLIATDWNDKARIEAYNEYSQAGGFLEPTSWLINGLGYQFNNNITRGPLTTLTVKKGKKYRIRFINAGFFDCPIEISIDNHPMLMIATDGADLQPTVADSLVSSSGERFDFVLEANQTVDTYWIRLKGYFLCERLGTFQVAILKYEGSPNEMPTTPMPTYATAAPKNGIVMNHVVLPTPGRTHITLGDLRAVVPNEKGLDSRYVKQFYIHLEMSGIDEPLYHVPGLFGFNQVDPDFRIRTPQLNHITHLGTPYESWPLMPARNRIDQSRFCNSETIAGKNCSGQFCTCSHVISVDLGEVVEFVFVESADQDQALAIHPMHLHGYHYRVIGWEITGPTTLEKVKEMDRRGQLKRNFNRPTLKDTVGVPRGGYVVVRFTADNPGFWLLHCHIDVHTSYGMEMVVKVGKNWQIPDAPPNFPVCGSYYR